MEAGTLVSLLAQIAREFATSFNNVLKAENRLKEHGIAKLHLRDPSCTHDMHPAPIIGRFERAAPERAELALD